MGYYAPEFIFLVLNLSFFDPILSYFGPILSYFGFIYPTLLWSLTLD